MTTQQNIQDRLIGKSIKKAITAIHSEPVYGYVEAVINAFTAMRHLPPESRIVRITLPRGNARNYSDDAHIIGEGTGFLRYDFIEKNMGYDTESEDYKLEQIDPDYLNKMGIGIPTIATLSKKGIAEFRSVSINAKGQEEGLVATYTLADNGGFIIPAEHPDSKYVFELEGRKLAIKTGVWVKVVDAKYYQVDRIYRLLSEIFARKLLAGYRITLLGPNDKEPREILPPEDFCHKHELIIGYIHDDKLNADFPVYADIHAAKKPSEAKMRILMKKMKIGEYPSEYLAKGHFGCDVLEFKPDREGISIDPYDPKYKQVEQLVLKEFARLKIEKKPTEEMKNLKAAKKWKQKAQEVFMRYFTKNRGDSLLRVDSLPNPTSPLTSKTDPNGKVTAPTRRCPNGYHWDKKSKQCIAIVEPSEQSPKIKTDSYDTTRQNEPHIGKRKKGTKKKNHLDEQYTEQSIPNFGTAKGSDTTKPLVWIDEQSSKLFFNTYYDWVKDVWENANERTMELLICMAIMDAVPENKVLTPQEWQSKLAASL